MRNRVLYFPYIRVPRSRWLTQLLLYWDEVSSIVPYEYIQRPESLGPYMHALVREGLVVQVLPGAHIYRVPRFDSAFQAYLEGLGPEVEQRRRRFKGGATFNVHVEKMREVSETLVALRLARQARYPWYEVEKDTADDFMSYLATILGRLPEVDASPITDNAAYLRRLARSGVRKDAIENQLDSLRLTLLDAVLPVPDRVIAPSEIREFKTRHQRALGDFRRRVEREIIQAAGIPNPALRDRHLAVFVDEVEARIAEIQATMQGVGWRTARASLSVLAAIPGVTPLVGLASTIWKALSDLDRRVEATDFAYAAYARTELIATV